MTLIIENTCRTCLVTTAILTPIDKKISIDSEIIDLKRILEICADLEVRTEFLF